MDKPQTRAGQWLLDRSQWDEGLRAFRVRINATAGPDDMHRHILAIEAEASTDPCPHCNPRHEWPCPTIPRCDEPGCPQEATCGWPSPAGYRRTCGPHFIALREVRRDSSR